MVADHGRDLIGGNAMAAPQLDQSRVLGVFEAELA